MLVVKKTNDIAQLLIIWILAVSVGTFTAIQINSYIDHKIKEERILVNRN